MAYATVSDYEARFGDCMDDALAEILDDASRIIDAELAGRGIDAASLPEGAAMQVCRNMAHRALGQPSGSIPPGVTQVSQGAGGYTQQFTLGNPYGDLYMTKAERSMLGIKGARCAFAWPGGAKC